MRLQDILQEIRAMSRGEIAVRVMWMAACTALALLVEDSGFAIAQLGGLGAFGELGDRDRQSDPAPSTSAQTTPQFDPILAALSNEAGLGLGQFDPQTLLQGSPANQAIAIMNQSARTEQEKALAVKVFDAAFRDYRKVDHPKNFDDLGNEEKRVLRELAGRAGYASLQDLLQAEKTFRDRVEPIIDQFAVLAAYMPVVASVGGNSGAQSQAIVIRAMAFDSIPSQMVRRVMLRSTVIGLVNGIVIGLLSGTIAGVFTGEIKIAFVIGLATLANLVIANVVGSGIPVALERLGQDPALASNIFMTMVTDMVGFGGFLAIATALL